MACRGEVHLSLLLCDKWCHAFGGQAEDKFKLGVLWGEVHLVGGSAGLEGEGEVFLSTGGGLGFIIFFPPGHRPYGPVAGK